MKIDIEPYPVPGIVDRSRYSTCSLYLRTYITVLTATVIVGSHSTPRVAQARGLWQRLVQYSAYLYQQKSQVVINAYGAKSQCQ
jgi:hypothetical protein